MTVERAEGIVLRRQAVMESSLLVTWFTREFGQLKTLAKGARRPKSTFRGQLDLFYHDELVWRRSRHSDLHLLQECYLVRPYLAASRLWQSLVAASYVGELIEMATVPEDALPAVFDLLETVLDSLATQPAPLTVLWCELQLLRALGWERPMSDAAGATRLLWSVARQDLVTLKRTRLTGEQLGQLRRLVWGTWDAVLERVPRSRKWLVNALAA